LSSKLLVTGATGLVGANLVRALLEQGRQVRALVHEDRRALADLDVEMVSGDVCDQIALERAMAGVEVVYHLAASISLEMGSGPEMEAINAQGTHNVVEACLKSGVRRLVHFSSVDALRQEPFDQPLDENRPLIDADLRADALAGIPPYDLSKAQGEREVLTGIARGLDALIIRPTAMLGPYDFKPSYLGQALILLANGKIPALVSGGFDWVDVRDVVAGVISAEKVAPSGACFMLGGNWHTVRQVAEVVAGISHRSAPLFTVPIWLAYAFAPVMLTLAHVNGTQPIYTRVTLTALRGNVHVSSERAVRDLGYCSRPLKQTVRDTLAWFREHGYLKGTSP
jgi:dihydroflavonol-4-reductase